jgi:beta-glucosidase
LAFPPGFLWGAATSAYQIEGAVAEDGRGESIWDRFSHTPGAIRDGTSGDEACDHYHRWRQDVDLMAGIGLNAYRFSIAWPRVVPDGAGAVNQRGIDFYSRLVDGLLDRGIAPMATLYHWDLPQALQDRAGGWASRETAERFGEYATAVFRALGDRVGHWVTLNEPWVSAFLGHHRGVHAPGARDLAVAVRASHHLLVGHANALVAYRSLGLAGHIGITLDLQVSTPATDSPADHAAAVLADGATNRWFLDPLLRGTYPADIIELYAAHGAPLGDDVQPGDLARISGKVDFLGVNYYFRRFVRASSEGLGWTEDLGPTSEQGGPTEMGWNIDPDGLAEQLGRLRADYPPLPIHVTENGIALPDQPDGNGVVHDPARIDYLEAHIRAAERAMDAGTDLRGYFVWSLLDNFEWSYGYRPRFGLVHVDYATHRRTPKSSAGWYGEVIRANGRT